MCLVAIAYSFSLGDIIIGYMKVVDNMLNPTDNLSDKMYAYYGQTRDFSISVIFNFLVPFLFLMSYANSFINSNQNIVSYFIQAMGVLLATPLAIYIFSYVLTNLLNISFINPNYVATNFFSNFTLILVVNMLIALTSFVWIKKQSSG
jgi:hypothetical protein